jgi:membrane protease subunit (stomatin/prohibitin family)
MDEITLDNAVNWFQSLTDRTPMPGARGMFQYALAALRAEQERNKGCDLCHRGKPIKAHTYLPDCGLQYGVSVQADFCPKCGRRLTEGSAE